MPAARKRYELFAPLYDRLDGSAEWVFGAMRRRLWSGVGAGRVLEVGAGTGRSLGLHPEGSDVLLTDFSRRMLGRAARKARRSGVAAPMHVADVQDLPYRDGVFDAVVGSLVFCTVPEPEAGLREIRRVLRPGGRLHMLEHVDSRRPVQRLLLRCAHPVLNAALGDDCLRDTVATVRRVGFQDVRETDLASDVMKIIRATRR